MPLRRTDTQRSAIVGRPTMSWFDPTPSGGGSGGALAQPAMAQAAPTAAPTGISPDVVARDVRGGDPFVAGLAQVPGQTERDAIITGLSQRLAGFSPLDLANTVMNPGPLSFADTLAKGMNTNYAAARLGGIVDRSGDYGIVSPETLGSYVNASKLSDPSSDLQNINLGIHRPDQLQDIRSLTKTMDKLNPGPVLSRITGLPLAMTLKERLKGLPDEYGDTRGNLATNWTGQELMGQEVADYMNEVNAAKNLASQPEKQRKAAVAAALAPKASPENDLAPQLGLAPDSAGLPSAAQGVAGPGAAFGLTPIQAGGPADLPLAAQGVAGPGAAFGLGPVQIGGGGSSSVPGGGAAAGYAGQGAAFGLGPVGISDDYGGSGWGGGWGGDVSGKDSSGHGMG